MNPTPIKYFGDKTTYPRMIKDISSEDVSSIEADVVFEELINNETFIAEAKQARKGVTNNPDKYPNLSLKYSNLLKK